MRKDMERVTLKRIAELAGTSIGTVDRALAGRPGIRAETKARVLQIARELGYQPSRFALGGKHPIKIGMVYPQEPAGFFGDIDRGIEAATRELVNLGVTVEKIRYQAQNPVDQAALLSQIDAAAFDGLAVNVATRGSALQIDRLSREGLPVITFNTDAPESARLFFVGNDSIQSGRMGAELLSRYIGGSGGVTVMGNFIQSMPFSERFGGFCEVIHTEYPDITLYPCAECYSDPEVATKNLTVALNQVPTMRGVYCTGFSCTIGAINAIRALNRKDITLIGFDVGSESIAALREGWCDALLFQDPFAQGYRAVHLLSRHIMEGWLPENGLVHVETRIVIKHNLERYAGVGMRADDFVEGGTFENPR